MTLGQLFSQGGLAMYPIYLCSLIALAVFLKKFIDLYRSRLLDSSWAVAVVEDLQKGEWESAKTRVENVDHQAGVVVLAMMEMHRKRADRVEAEAARVGSLVIQKLESRIAMLSFIAQVAPLLGLLGTVLGMVDLFMGLQGAGLANVDAALLASGIWKALLTTAAGLMVAVPTLAGYAMLNGRTDRFRLVLADTISRIQSAMLVAEVSSVPSPKSRVALVEEAHAL